MHTSEARPLFRPADAALRFLPEGPYACAPGQFSWVAIQHGAAAVVGSLNLFDLTLGTNQRWDLPGRPGFAFPATDGHSWVVGLEHHVYLFDTLTGRCSEVCGPVDTGVTGTIINDGTIFEDGLIFGCKDLRFTDRKAGLYFWRAADRHLFPLRHDQTCSNGKKVRRQNGQLSLLDIDSPTKTLVEYPLDVAGGTLGEPRVVLDLRAGESFPDGMILTPDAQSVIIAFYDPRDVSHGETRQYRLADGTVEHIWRTPGSPRVTCPALVPTGTGTTLVLTTAVEHMTLSQEAQHPHAGCLFQAATHFPTVPLGPRFSWL
ncbi:MAG: SMP-30/gluconolactonase/LRE family protein [Pirellulales bacterium]